MSPARGPGSSGPGRLLIARLGLALVALITALLLAEGGVSLISGRSLLSSRPPVATTIPAVRLGTDAERLAAGLSAEGELRGHVDPLVGIMMAGGEGYRTFDAISSIRPDGVRGRPAPMPDEVARHIVILGDSVAFGYGVNDDETIAHQLEQVFAQLRGPEALPIVASTVAVPGWNHRNAVHFLIDHLVHLAPDIVVFMPVANDLTDTFGVTEGGHRALLPDPAQPDPWLSVHDEPLLAFIARSMAAAKARGEVSDLGEDAAGPHALLADLSAESQRRYDAAADSIALLSRILKRVDAQLLLAYFAENNYGWTVRARLLEAAVDVPSVSLYTSPPKACQLVQDPHPNALGVSFMARWIAEDLLDRGWVDRGANLPLPPLPELAAQHRAQKPLPQQALTQAREAAAAARQILQGRIDTANGRGVHQIYGGLNQDGSLGPAFAAVIAPGSLVEVILAPVTKLPQLYPLRVGVSLDGVPVGELIVPATGQQRDVFSRPAGMAADTPIEVKLSPELWGVQLAFGRSQVASCRLLSIDSSP